MTKTSTQVPQLPTRANTKEERAAIERFIREAPRRTADQLRAARKAKEAGRG
jgi:hypothetical protein